MRKKDKSAIFEPKWRLVHPAKKPALLGDAALAAGKITRDGQRLVIPVYNLGVVPMHDLTVTLNDKNGHRLVEKPLKHLPGVEAWKLGEAVITFEDIPKEAVHVEVSTQEPEITTLNNGAPLPVY